MKKFHYLDTIISPIVTEKSTSLSEFNKVVFKVHRGSNKSSIKKSIEKIFKVNVVKINTIKCRKLLVSLIKKATKETVTKVIDPVKSKKCSVDNRYEGIKTIHWNKKIVIVHSKNKLTDPYVTLFWSTIDVNKKQNTITSNVKKKF